MSRLFGSVGFGTLAVSRCTVAPGRSTTEPIVAYASGAHALSSVVMSFCSTVTVGAVLGESHYQER